MPYYLCIVGARDNLLYEADLSVRPTPAGPGPQSSAEGSKSSGIFGFSSAFSAWASPLAKPSTPTPSESHSNSALGSKPSLNLESSGDRAMLQMIAHGSLDVLEDKQYVDSSVYVLLANECSYLKNLEQIHGWSVSAFIIPGRRYDASRIILTQMRN